MLYDRNSRKIQGIPGRCFERSYSALAKDHVRVALRKNILRAHQPFLDRGRHAPFQQYRRHEIGYRTKLIFLSLHDVDMAIERVKFRVAQGGHNINESVIRRRFDKGLNNFHNVYKKLVDSWILYDNSDESPRLIDEGENI